MLIFSLGRRESAPENQILAVGGVECLDRPVLVVVAGRSRLHDPARVAAAAARLLPQGRVVMHAEVSHAVNGEQPERIAPDVAAFRASL